MKIGQLDSKPAVAPAANDRAAERPASAGKTPAAGDSSAKVDLSAAVTALAGLPMDESFDISKVDRIAQAIRDGKFEVNAEVIADKLIANAQELLGKDGA